MPRTVPLEGLELAMLELMAPYERPESRSESDSAPDPERSCPCARTFARYMAECVGSAVMPDRKHSPMATVIELFRVRGCAETVLRRHARPNPACVYCHGSGRYDPHLQFEPQFDGISYGWDHTGWIRGKPRLRDRNERYPTIEENYTTVPELLARQAAGDDICTNSLLTPDGEWFSAGWMTMMWTVGRAKQFEAEFIERLSRTPDGWAVGLECHY